MYAKDHAQVNSQTQTSDKTPLTKGSLGVNTNIMDKHY